MQEVKTLFHRVDSEKACAESDAIINALLADGWTIQATTIAAAVGNAEYSTEAYLSVLLVRETQPAPVETPREAVERTFLVDDRVQIGCGKFEGISGSVHDVYRNGTRYAVELDNDMMDVFWLHELRPEPNDE